ncbi:MAG: hypothetical protein HQL26_06310 [Candidatus Omnitrophica bacterium]|nr:hypothetical protein [Candidatus Omnitrophota bacterium]
MNPSLFEQIIARENLFISAHRAALGKRFRENIADWKYRMENEVEMRLHRKEKSAVCRLAI